MVELRATGSRAPGSTNGEPPTDNGGESVDAVAAVRARAARSRGSGGGVRQRRTRERAIARSPTRSARGRQAHRLGRGQAAFRRHARRSGPTASTSTCWRCSPASLPQAEQAAFMTRVLDDRSLTQATYYFQFYLFRAMKKAGLGDDYLAQLGPWRQMLDLGLTTWAETAGADALRLARLERAPELRPADDRRRDRTGRARLRERSASSRTWLTLTAAKASVADATRRHRGQLRADRRRLDADVTLPPRRHRHVGVERQAPLADSRTATRACSDISGLQRPFEHHASVRAARGFRPIARTAGAFRCGRADCVASSTYRSTAACSSSIATCS